MLRSGDHYVLLPRSWSAGDGVAIVLPRSADVRLEYRGPDVPRGCCPGHNRVHGVTVT